MMTMTIGVLINLEQPIVVEWNGNKITMTVEGKGAESVYYDYFMRQFEKGATGPGVDFMWVTDFWREVK